MFPPQFLSSYCIFAATVSAFRSSQEIAATVPEQKAIVDAFKKATQGMSYREQKAFIEYGQCLFHLPKESRRDELNRYSAEVALDHALGKRGAWLIDDGSIIIVDEFIIRSGIGQDVLTQKLLERRIFKMPDWVHLVWGDDYFPAFFADSRYDLNSLETVSMALRATYNGIRKYRFFTTSDSSLGTPND